MSNLVTIDGASVDLEKPCDVVAALKRVEMKLGIGAAISRTNIGGEEVEFTAANPSRLQKLIGTYEAKCAATNGQRTRFAKRVNWI
jgi:hypothetical protein